MSQMDDTNHTDRMPEATDTRSGGIWSSIPVFVRWLTGIVAGWIITELLSGAWDFVPSPWDFLKSMLTHAWSPWVLATVSLVSVVLLYIAARRIFQDMHNTIDEVMNVATDTVNAQKELNELLNTQLDVALNVVRIESNMLWALDNLVFSKDVPLACKNMIRMILSENAHLLDDVIFRCYVLRPDGDYLTSYVAQQIPDPDGYERKFYVGGDPLIRGGVAGKAFKENSMEIARRIDDSDPLKGVVFDHEDYVPLDDSVPAPQYRSFICIPLRPDRDTCLGILCLDSEDQSAFDDPDRQQYLSALSTLIAFILELSDKSQQQDTQSDQLPRADQPSKVEIDSTDGDMPCQPS